MARKKAKKPVATATPAVRRPDKVTAPPPEGPAFWFAFEVPWAKVAITRALLFGLLALDALLQIRHAPRYGAGFNVAQLPLIDSLGPTRNSFAIAQLLEAYLFVLAAIGVATRVVVPLAAAVYAWLYFGSQLDSYQHHYLVVMVLAIASFVPWARPDGATASTPVRSWALRLILVQIAIMYAWAAVSKLDASWLDGSTLGLQLGSSALPHGDKVPMTSSLIEHTVGWALAAKLVLLAEITLAATVWNRRTWIVAAPLGLAFHFGIVFTDLEIGLFAWLMMGMYALVVPDAVWVRLAGLLRPLAEADARAGRALAPRAWLVVGASFALGLGFAALSRLDHATSVAIVATSGALVIAILRLRAHKSAVPIAVAHACALLLWLAVGRITTVATDYYRLWGGSSRRLGDLDAAEEAWRTVVAMDADNADARFKLGRVLLEHDLPGDGLTELHIARDLEPHVARAWLEEAKWHARHGRRDDALAAARAGLAAEPSSVEARQLVDAITRGKPVAPEEP